MKSSIMFVSCFAVGIICSLFHIIPRIDDSSEIGFYALCVLIFSVGLSVGHDAEVISNIRHMQPQFLLLPAATIIGTLTGCLLLGLFWHQQSVTSTLAVGSGFGYYSLSAILITQFRGAEIGTVALIANIIREMVTLLFAPVIVKYMGRAALISAGGATTMDTTLPIILRSAGKEWTGISVLHGIVTDFSVPFLVTLFCTF